MKVLAEAAAGRQLWAGTLSETVGATAIAFSATEYALKITCAGGHERLFVLEPKRRSARSISACLVTASSPGRRSSASRTHSAAHSRLARRRRTHRARAKQLPPPRGVGVGAGAAEAGAAAAGAAAAVAAADKKARRA